jgi:hypothetical protein
VWRARALVPFVLFAQLVTPKWVSAEDATARPTVVFFAPAQLEPDMRSALDDALATQLMSLSVDLSFEVEGDGADTLEERLDAMKQTANEHRALAIFWLEIRRPDRWFLYTTDAQVERVVLRPLPAKPGNLEAAFESVAVVVRATTDALLHGEPLAAAVEPPPVAAAPAAEPKPKPPEPWPTVQADGKDSALRVAASYVGTIFAKELLWQSGFGLHADWLWPAGTFVGLGYVFFPQAEFDKEGFRFQLDRHPISLRSGLRFASGPFTFTGELDAEIELRIRQKAENLAGENIAFSGARKTIISVCPRLESEFTVTAWLRLFLGVGIDFVLSNPKYEVVAEPEHMSETILAPWPVRLTLRAGIAILR